MRFQTTTSWLAASAALLATAVMAGPASAAPSATAAAAAPITHRTIFATKAGTLYRLTLSPTGAVTTRTPVADGANATASDYDGTRLVFIRSDGAPGRADDQVWLREATGGSHYLAPGHLGTFSPGRTGVTIARDVAETDPREPHHDEVSVYRLTDGHVFPLFSYDWGESNHRIRNSRDGKSLWLFRNRDNGVFQTLDRYDRATDTVVPRPGQTSTDRCSDVEILPTGANALIACDGELLTFRLATDKIIHRTALPRGVWAATVDGRLDTKTMLLSLGSDTRRWLAALDLTTMRIRTLPGTAGYTNGVAAY
jgi:hypothetical protein